MIAVRASRNRSLRFLQTKDLIKQLTLQLYRRHRLTLRKPALAPDAAPSYSAAEVFCGAGFEADQPRASPAAILRGHCRPVRRSLAGTRKAPSLREVRQELDDRMPE